MEIPIAVIERKLLPFSGGILGGWVGDTSGSAQGYLSSGSLIRNYSWGGGAGTVAQW